MRLIFKKVIFRLFYPIKYLFLHPAIRYRLIFSNVFSAHPDEVMLKKAMEFAAQANTGGDYLEFGVWRGRSFVKAYHIWKFVSRNTKNLDSIRFYAFDSFEGLPEINAEEDKKTGEFTRGQYACSDDEFKKIIIKKGVDLSKVKIVKGWYKEVLNETTKQNLSIKSAAIIYIDSDLYESAVSVLNFVTDYITDGTLIIFDDWFCFKGKPERGEQKAFYEWLRNNPQFRATEYQRFNWKGNSFIIWLDDK